MVNCWSQVLERSGIEASDRLFFAFSFAPFLGFWTAFDAALRLGSLCIPGGGLSSAARLAMMIENRVTGLLCTPTYALRLGEVARTQELNPADLPLRAILVAGEPGGSVSGVRERIRELWPQARLIDHHGMTEIGPVSYQCPVRPGTLHVLESDYIAEVLEPHGSAAVDAGCLGELVLTNLGREGSPLIRYRSGDLVRVEAQKPCACGSSELALPGGILSRLDDMVVIRGINVYPSAVEDVLRACPEVEEYRVSIDTGSSLAQLKIDVEPGPDCRDPAGLIARIENELRMTFALRIPVALVEPGSLPRFEMKAKRWIRV
jgi:phenylacetate-CoA ligase